MTVSYLGAARIGSLLRSHGISPKKRLGQNFVIDPNTIRKMIETARIGPKDHVLEIGAGCGSLTVGLAAAAAQVTALEVDAGLIPVLQEAITASNVRIVHADALAADLGSFGATKLVANLPYNIAATVVLRALETAPDVDVVTVMTQREVGERLGAPPGSRVYGQTSVMTAFYGTAEIAGHVSRNAFFPVPRVDSVIVRIARHAPPAGVDRIKLFDVVRASFSQRRKTMRNALASVAGSTEDAERALRAAGVDPRARPETLSLDHFVSIVKELE